MWPENSTFICLCPGPGLSIVAGPLEATYHSPVQSSSTFDELFWALLSAILGPLSEPSRSHSRHSQLSGEGGVKHTKFPGKGLLLFLAIFWEKLEPSSPYGTIDIQNFKYQVDSWLYFWGVKRWTTQTSALCTWKSQIGPELDRIITFPSRGRFVQVSSQ